MMKTVYNLILSLNPESGKWVSVAQSIDMVIDYCREIDDPSIPKMIEYLKDLKTVVLLLVDDKYDEDDFWGLYAKVRDYAKDNRL